jgi:ABC-2 type transport system permease protein
VKGYFENTLKLVRFNLRRERLTALIWLVVVLSIAGAYPGFIVSQYSPAELAIMGDIMSNPAMVAILGMVQGLDNFHAGAMFATEFGLFTIVALGIMNIFLVVRHTRTDEELGRYEVLRSLPVGRLANLHSAMITAFIVNLVMGLSVAIVLGSLGIENITWVGSFTFGAMLFVSSMLFAGIAALCVQLSSSARSVKAYAFLVLVTFYLLRAIGDVNSEALARISPLGLILRAQPFVENYWWPILIVMLLALIVIAVAYRLCAFRDIGQGLIPDRPGPAQAGKNLQSLFGLTWRISRGTVIAWAVGIFVFGSVFGLVMGDVEYFVTDAEWFEQLMPPHPDFTMTEMFTVMMNLFLALFAVVPVLNLILRLRSEERNGRTEGLIGLAISRKSHIAGFAGLSFLAAVLMPLIGMIGMWALSIPMLDAPMSFWNLLQAVMIFVPALWIMMGFSLAIIGLWPKGAMVVWAYYAYVFISSFFGEMLNLPRWALYLSPFGHIPQLPMDDIRILPMLTLIVVAAILAVIGIIGYSRRDMVS